MTTVDQKYVQGNFSFRDRTHINSTARRALGSRYFYFNLNSTSSKQDAFPRTGLEVTGSELG